MDALVEFCRTGELTPLRKGMTAAEVEGMLGPPEKIKWMHGEQHLQRHRYGSLSLTITCLDAEPPDQEHLRLRSMGVSFDQLPLDLPAPIAERLTHPWTSRRLDDVLDLLHATGVATTLEHESSARAIRNRRFSAGQRPVAIVVVDDDVSRISG